MMRQERLDAWVMSGESSPRRREEFNNVTCRPWSGPGLDKPVAPVGKSGEDSYCACRCGWVFRLTDQLDWSTRLSLEPNIGSTPEPPFERHYQVHVELSWEIPKLASSEPFQEGLSIRLKPDFDSKRHESSMREKVHVLQR